MAVGSFGSLTRRTEQLTPQLREYSSLDIARVWQSGRLLCCDVNEAWTSVARRHWERARVADCVEMRLPPALETLAFLAPALGEGLAEAARVRLWSVGLVDTRAGEALDGAMLAITSVDLDEVSHRIETSPLIPDVTRRQLRTEPDPRSADRARDRKPRPHPGVCPRGVLPVIGGYWERAEFPFGLIEWMAKLDIVGDGIVGYGCR